MGKESAPEWSCHTVYFGSQPQMASQRFLDPSRQGSEAEGRVTELPRALQTEVWEA